MFVKYMSETQIETAPKNKGGIFNYHLNEAAMRADGYKPLWTASEPSDMVQPEIRYKDELDAVVQFYVDTYIAPPEPSYAEKRSVAYPEVGDQLDAILKGFMSIRDSGVELNSETNQLIVEWQAIKAKYPKPSEDINGN